MVGEAWTFCEQILPDVSRSFALIIPQCPPPIDRAMCVAYLLCRMADTIEDEAGLGPLQRDRLYDALLQAIDEPSDAAGAGELIRAWPAVPDGDYGRLIRGAADVLAVFAALPPDCREPIRVCVHEMVAGMRQMAPVETRNVVSFMCRDLADLDRYCHYVAGTVGLMSTALFAVRFDPAAFAVTAAWREQGRRFGLGLQMTNIIKDCRVDAQRGVSFIPARYVDLGQDGAYTLHGPGRAELVRHALGHLDAALAYVLAVPAEETGIRTFLLGSLLPAVATLEAAAPGDQFQPKISRALMADILGLIGARVADGPALAAWYEARREETLRRLG